MKNIEETLIVVLGVIIIIWLIEPLFKCSKNETFQLCDENGCRGNVQFVKEEGVVAGQDVDNIEKPYVEHIENKSEDSEKKSQKKEGGKIVIDKLDDGSDGDMGLLYAPCSMNCCSPQYPPPFKLSKDKHIDMDKYVPTSYKCNNAWNNSGCVCMTKEQRDFIASRGGNNK
jgi:hypothetical protein